MGANGSTSPISNANKLLASSERSGDTVDVVAVAASSTDSTVAASASRSATCELSSTLLSLSTWLESRNCSARRAPYIDVREVIVSGVGGCGANASVVVVANITDAAAIKRIHDGDN
eukprot:scaffold5469_cov175-Alexandrium_tamarense.AAC.9